MLYLGNLKIVKYLIFITVTQAFRKNKFKKEW